MKKIIYHQVKPGLDCPDGIASAWVAGKAFPDSVFEGCAYQQSELPYIEPFEQLIIVDFSFPRQRLESWERMGKQITIIDHHKTAFENFQDLSKSILQRFDMNECGATLTWKYFFPDKSIPKFLEYVRDRDLWNFDLPYSEEIHEAISFLKLQSSDEKCIPGSHKLTRTFQIFDMLEPLNEDALLTIFAPWGDKLLQPKRNFNS